MPNVDRECITHHNACDCREAKFVKLEQDNAALCREIGKLNFEADALREQSEMAVKENAALQKRVEELEAGMHWHELAKEQPTEEGIYLVLAKYGDCRTSNVIGSESGIKECIHWWNFGNVTHWLKIEPPQEKEKDNV